MKILVTGGTGVIGEGTLKALLKAGHRVRLLTRNANEAAREWPEDVEPFVADISDIESLAGAAADCDAIVHVAGIIEENPPDTTFELINIAGTKHILEEAARAGVPRFVFVSSLGADVGKSDYHRSKRAAEELVGGFQGEWLILRPGGVYGPGDDVFSTLLKMIRALPAVPVIDGGDQRFQFIWHEDLGRAIAQSIERDDLANQTLELAGAEIITMNELIDRLTEITGRTVARVPVPSFLASFGNAVAEAIGVDLPINDAKLAMLREENFIRNPEDNALIHVFNINPLPLDEGLRILADAIPEKLPSEGFGPLSRKLFWAEIEGSPHSPDELLELFRENITEIMPIEFSAEPGAPTTVELGATLTAALPARGNIQIRVVELTSRQITFATVEGHPLAGVVSFVSEAEGERIRFTVEIHTRAANAFDFLAMRTVGDRLQDTNWRQVVEGVIQLSEGRARDGVQDESITLDDEQARQVERWIEGLIVARKREAKAE